MGLAIATGWARSTDALWRRTIDGAIVAAEPEPLLLNGAAAVVWDLLEQPDDADGLIATVAAVFDVEREVVAADVRRIIDDLAGAGVVTHAPLAAAPAPTAMDDGGGDEPARRPPTDDPIAGIAGWRLRGSTLDLPDVETVGATALLDGVRRERLSGLAADAVRRGALVLPAERRDELAAIHRRSMLVALELERHLLEVVALLGDAGIEPLVIKGPSIAHRRYPDPSLRPFGDIDLLVRADDLDETYLRLHAAGFVRRFAEPRPGFDRRFAKGATFLAEDGFEIDVHRSFADGPFGVTSRPDEAFVAPDRFVLGGRELSTPNATITLVALAMHAVLGTRLPHLLNLRDVAQAAAEADADEAVAIAGRWRCETVLATAVVTAADRLAMVDAPVTRWARAHRPGRRQQLALLAYRSSARSYGLQRLATLPVVPSARGKVAYLRAMVVPSKEYVRGRDNSRLHRIGRMVRRAARPNPERR